MPARLVIRREVNSAKRVERAAGTRLALLRKVSDRKPDRDSTHERETSCAAGRDSRQRPCAACGVWFDAVQGAEYGRLRWR